MAVKAIPKRITTALVNSLGAGVTPRIGLEYMAVGRKDEIETLLNDLSNIGESGSVFRIIVGRYGSGKSFLLQIIRNYATDRGYVVADADLSPERKLCGTKGQGLATYRELMKNLSTKVRPDGGALPSILEKWTAQAQMAVIKENGINESDSNFFSLVGIKIAEIISSMDSMVHGFDFAKVMSAYWEGCRTGDQSKKSAALKWFRGEYSTKTEAYAELGVRVIVDDESWYDYIKLMSAFVKSVGYTGFLVLLDEGVNLYKIPNTIARNNNYEKLLSMFNDAMQGRTAGLGIYLCGTPQFVEDNRRGLFSYEALKSRLVSTRYAKDGIRDMQSPLIYLDRLTNEELYVLLLKVKDIHEQHFNYKSNITSENMIDFMRAATGRLGADELLTPREIVRDFIGIMNILHQNAEFTFDGLLSGDLFKTTHPADLEDDDDEAAVFEL
ncbi:MAG: ATP-binding protein [Eubacteriales bacterium]|nr:ATP-binding protein [Eubacteriales bacterium]MDD4474489.1 ATP-binding protein [Eubacteriales bacterium]